MNSLVVLFWDIARLRKGPADVPDSVFLIRLLVVLSVAVSLLVGALSMPFLQSILWVSVDLAATVLLLNVALQVRGQRERFNQAFAAILGVGILLNIVIAPVYFVIAQQPADASGEQSAGFLLSLIFMAIVVWNVMVLGHILSKTFEMARFLGIGFAILYWWLVNWLITTLVP